MSACARNSIDEIMDLIQWDQPETEQQRGIAMAREVRCLKAFFQPGSREYGKNVWDNCAEIICERSDEELRYYITDMLLWLEDLNWPGAELIQERLKQFREVNMLVMYLNDWVPALNKLGKRAWLSAIAEILDNPNLEGRLNPDTIQILLEYRH